MYLKKNIIIYICVNTFLFLVLTFKSYSQNEELKKADTFIENKNYNEAINIYEGLLKKVGDEIPSFHENYLLALKEQNEQKKTKKYLKKLLKNNKSNTSLSIDYFKFLMDTEDSISAIKFKEDFLKIISEQPEQLETAALLFENENMHLDAINALNQLEKISRQKFTKKLAENYLKAGDLENATRKYLDELNTDNESEADLDDFLVFINEKIMPLDNHVFLEKLILEYSQKDPQNIYYPEILMWYYVQKEDYYSAFLQGKSIDRRNKKIGEKLLPLGERAIKAKIYQEAEIILEYVKEKTSNDFTKAKAWELLIFAKEEQLKKNGHVNKESVQSLLQEYQQIVDVYGISNNSIDIALKLADLKAKYLNNSEEAIELLQKYLNSNRIYGKQKTKIKLKLAEVYITSDNPWESALLYQQIEREEQGNKYEQEARIGRARVFYFMGDFKLSASILDVLKLATHKEIANDAIDFALLIKENQDLDSADAVLRTYAGAELDFFKKNIDKAITKFDSILINCSNHPLVDEAAFQKAKVLSYKNDHKEAINTLQKIVETNPESILAEEIDYTIAKTYDKDLSEKERAMNLYLEHITKFPGSIHREEARERYRKLRGDRI